MFTPSQNECRLIPGLNFTCHVRVSTWMIGGQALDSAENQNSIQISLWRRDTGNDDNDIVHLERLIPIGKLSPRNEPNIYIISTDLIDIEPGWFIGISLLTSSSFSLYYMNGGPDSYQTYIFDPEKELNERELLLQEDNNRQLALPLLRPMEIGKLH